VNRAVVNKFENELLSCHLSDDLVFFKYCEK